MNRKLVVFVPPEALDAVRDALFAAGAGRIGAYERCSWYTEGTGTFFGGGPGLRQALAPDPATLHAIATATGGKFYPAKSAGAVEDAYAKLGSSLGRVPGRSEVTADFVIGAAALQLVAGILGALWAPRLP